MIQLIFTVNVFPTRPHIGTIDLGRPAVVEGGIPDTIGERLSSLLWVNIPRKSSFVLLSGQYTGKVTLF